jgi:hypothetical protein
MSRTKALKKRSLPARQSVSDSSIGNSSPSRRRATISIVAPIRRDGPPDARRSRPAWWPARKRSGMIRSSGWPSISAADQPKIVSAAWFQSLTTPAASVVMMASLAEAITERNLSSEARSASSASRRSVMSCAEPAIRAGVPSAARWTMPRLRNHRQSPSLWRMRNSIENSGEPPARCSAMRALVGSRSSGWTSRSQVAKALGSSWSA